MAELPPGSTPEMSVLFDLWLVNHLISGALDDVLTVTGGLSGEDFGFYSLLRRFGPVTPSQVVRWTAMRPTTVSTLVRRLQQRGHVEQRPNPADGRSRLLALTPAGEDAHTRTADAFFAATRTLAAALGPDEPRQRAALQRLDTALREVGGLDPRPYTVPAAPLEGPPGLSYDGPPLTAGEEAHVRAYIGFIRSRRQEGTRHVPDPHPAR
ncbi:DNA-binding MarR family transcriptional regulator [Geodermatophilus normandii]|uniref:DNA-binding MarR family transcriptional regulator n=1 Tax=Geodermatophilus normandii TaxID=1137989 RepID=A0A317QKL5_9ACTN|nr:MarR family winged helix-turn-helix transcriptional regulator [Geodermatophilus normandii]PWW24268.1 DNA-binding MarR family transcriptional regulator [Geodermatophilus normandii]